MSLEQNVQQNADAIAALISNAKTVIQLDDLSVSVDYDEDRLIYYSNELGKAVEVSITEFIAILPTNSVQEYSQMSNFPVTGLSNVIYIDAQFNIIYRWDGSSYVQLGAQNINRPIENRYADITELQADQGNQTLGFVQMVEDATDDPAIGTDIAAFYIYNGTTTGVLITDYQLMSDEQVAAIPLSGVSRVFRVNSISTTEPTTSDSGEVDIYYENTGDTLLSILFPQDYSDYITQMASYASTSNKFSVNIFNKTKQLWMGCVNTTFTVVNTNYYKVDIDPSDIPLANVDVDDKLEIFIDLYSTSAAATPTEEEIIGNAAEDLTLTGAENIDLSANADMYLKLTGNTIITFTNTPAVGKSIVRTYTVESSVAETLGITNSTDEFGTYAADTTINEMTVKASNYATEGLIIRVFFSQPN